MLRYFQFTSERKASSIVVRDEQGKLFVFVKGADSSMKLMFKAGNSFESYIDQEVERYAAIGLRTLVFGYRELTQKDLDTFKTAHMKRQTEMSEAVDWDWDQLQPKDIECDLTPLAVTAVEDLLQENVKNCIEDFKKAGIKVWMLTGDKGLTAKMISIQCGLISNSDKSELVQIAASQNENEISANIEKAKEQVKSAENFQLMVDGQTMAQILSHQKL